MKIGCTCGYVISDVADYLPNEARVIASQDWEDFNLSLKGPWDFDVSLVRRMFQCVSCGRLYMFGPDQALLTFVPEDAPQPVLRSVRGSAWRGPLVGSWWDSLGWEHPGMLDCSAEGGTFEKFDDWSALERAYMELFTRLRAADRLRSAYLHRNGVAVHRWLVDDEQGGS
jgi:hypothetical protein